MEIDGYMIRVSWDGSTLTVRPQNKTARVALLGPNRDAKSVREFWQTDDKLVLRREDIASVTLKNASPLMNGNLVVATTNGQRYQLNFRRKSRDGFNRLASALRP